MNDLIHNIETIGIQQFAETILNNRQRTSAKNGILKAEAVYLWAKILANNGVQTLQDIGDGLPSQVENEIMKIPGQRSGISLRYFYMLSGNDNVCKPDRHILAFLSETLDRNVPYTEAQGLFIKAVALLKDNYPNVSVRLLDNIIWGYMSTSK